MKRKHMRLADRRALERAILRKMRSLQLGYGNSAEPPKLTERDQAELIGLECARRRI